MDASLFLPGDNLDERVHKIITGVGIGPGPVQLLGVVPKYSTQSDDNAKVIAWLQQDGWIEDHADWADARAKRAFKLIISKPDTKPVKVINAKDVCHAYCVALIGARGH